MKAFWKKLCLTLVSACCFFSYSNAQVAGTPDPVTGIPIQETGNLVSPTGWTGQTKTGSHGGANPRDHVYGCCTGGPGALVDTSGGSSIWFSYSTSTVAQSIAINNALSGTGIRVNGVNYGYQFYNQDTNRGTLSSTLRVTNSSGVQTHSTTASHEKTTSGWTSYSNTVSLNRASLVDLGTVTLSFTGKDDRFWAGYYGPAVTNPYVRLAYTADLCAANPLSSPDCEGYAAAFKTQQCTANPLFDPTCPGYAVAYKTQQCTANPLFDPTCPGYEVAYFNQQCSLNPLYNSTCPGYEVAYFNQQCSLNPLYNVGCPGYAQAFFNQECKKSALYNIQCPGYQEAYFAQQCSLNPLYNNGCPGYAQAYLTQQCNITQLFSTDCPLYKEAYFNQQCTLSPLYDAKCVGYAEAFFNQQCVANPLYNNQCPGYAKAFFDQQCGLNPLYNTGCPLYQQAYLTQQCNLNQLYSTVCPGYQQAYFSQQCQLNTLYNPGCPGYAEAYRAKLLADSCQANPQSSPQCPGYRATTVSNTTQSTNLADATDPVKSITENPLVADPVTNAILTTTVSKTDGTGPVNVVNPPSALGQGLQVPGLMPGVQLSPPPRASRSTTTQSARTAAAQQAIQQARTLSAEQQKEEATMAAMATVPGFDAYQNAVIPDARFYIQEQIYRRANLPDNQRAQRALSQRSDRLHQQMVDQQYNLVGPAR